MIDCGEGAVEMLNACILFPKRNQKYTLGNYISWRVRSAMDF